MTDTKQDALRYEVWYFDDANEYVGCCGDQHPSRDQARLCLELHTPRAWRPNIQECEEAL
jgi:hypothetical protein